MNVVNSDERQLVPMTDNDLIVKRFVPTVVYVRETADFHTRLCLYNYFSELFPDIKTGARVYLRFFDANGHLFAERKINVPYRGQLQFEVSDLNTEFEGSVGVSMVPDTLPEIKPQRVGTGYYVFYYDNTGHADFSHEWESMRFQPSQSVPWLCVVRPLLFPATQLIVMSSFYGSGPEGTAHWHVRLRNSQGQILAEREMEPIPPRGCRRFELQTAFPDIKALAQREGTVAIEVVGSNIQGPFTWVTVPSGDFNIHHFC
jgi:hypothetical protein